MKRIIPLGCAACQRRSVLRAGLGLLLFPWWSTKAKAQDGATAPPQPGDHFVHLTGPKEGQIVKSDDVVLDDLQVQAFPASPEGVVRNGTPLNLVLLVRVDSEGVSEETRAHSADGVAAFSGACTHQGCPVSMWSKRHKTLFCSCHGSEFNPKNGAEVVFGPAPRPLPALPLKSENKVLMVAGPFSSRVWAFGQ
jgi:Rieske Fe-S protein